MSMFSSEGYDEFLKKKGTSRGLERKNAMNLTNPKVKEAQQKYKNTWIAVNIESAVNYRNFKK